MEQPRRRAGTRPTTTTLRGPGLATVVVLALAGASCGSEAAPEPTVASTAATPTASPTADATPPTLSDGASDDGSGDDGSAVTTPTGDPPAPTAVDGTPAADGMAPVVDEAGLVAGEERSAQLLNETRVGGGLAELERDPDLDAAARAWSRQMAERGQLMHSGEGAGENIAFSADTSLSPEQAAQVFHELWLAEPDHRANLVNRTYGRTGIGMWLGPAGWYGTQIYGY